MQESAEKTHMKLLSLLMLLCASMALGCSERLKDECMRWNSLPIGIAANNDDDRGVLQAFNNAVGIEVFVDDPDGVPIVELDDDEFKAKAPYAGEHEIVIAFALTQGSNQLCEITEAIIYVHEGFYNEINNNYYTYNSYQELLGHELGHVLGLPHMDEGLMNPHLNARIDFKDNFTPELLDEIKNKYQEYFGEN